MGVRVPRWAPSFGSSLSGSSLLSVGNSKNKIKNGSSPSGSFHFTVDRFKGWLL
jgi:hypothetical protein